MTTKEKCDYIRHALECLRSDDLERAEHAFRGMTDAQLDEQHGQSGLMRRQILELYRRNRQKHEECALFLESVFKATECL